MYLEYSEDFILLCKSCIRSSAVTGRNNVAVEVVGGSTRVGHSICIRAFVHVGHTRSLSVHVAHYHMMCAYVTKRGTIGYYIMCMKGDPVLSV